MKCFIFNFIIAFFIVHFSLAESSKPKAIEEELGKVLVFDLSKKKKKPESEGRLKDIKKFGEGEYVRKITPIETERFKRYLKEGIEEYSINKYLIALEYFNKAVRENPRHYLGYYYRGLSYYMLAIHYNEKSEYTKEDLFSKSKNNLEESIRLNKTAGAFFYLFYISRINNDHIEANRHLNSFFKMKDKNDFINNYLSKDVYISKFYLVAGVTKSILSYDSPAVKIFNQAIKKFPTSFTAYDVKAQHYFNNNKIKSAIRVYSNYIDLVSKAYRHQIPQYEQSLQLAYFHRARLFVVLGEKIKALSDFSESYKLNPNIPLINYYYAQLLLDYQKTDLAIETASRGIDSFSGSWNNVSVFFNELSREPISESDFNKIFPALHEIKADALQIQKEYFLAKRNYEKILELFKDDKYSGSKEYLKEISKKIKDMEKKLSDNSRDSVSSSKQETELNSCQKPFTKD